MENERIRITLDQIDKIYIAGQTIKGEIRLNLQRSTKIRAIKVQITGKGKCKWIEILRKNSPNDSTRSLFYSSREVYVQSEQSLSVFEPRGMLLGPGEHQFEFFQPLDWLLPSSFKGSYGSIKYKLRIIIKRAWSLDERHIIPITIFKNMPLQRAYRVNPTSLEKQITKSISLFGTRPITLLGLLPEDFAVRGEPMRICATVINNSTTNVEKLRFCVLQHITYYSHVPLRIQKLETITIAHKETGAVQKKSQRSFAHELIIPDYAQPTDEELSGIINVTYEIRVEAVLRGFFKNIILNLPFKLYSNDATISTNTDNTTTYPLPVYGIETVGVENCNNSVSGGNPFETTNNSIAVCSSIDSTSTLSQYSESSSITSTISDSSATTLSPNVGNGASSCGSSIGALSHPSESSPYARASQRSSNVPYMPYSNSPLMISSYPPPGMPVHLTITDATPDYALYAQIRTTPPPSSQTPPVVASTSTGAAMSVSFLQSRFPPGVHELPPSYEELFGNATAPPAAVAK